MPSTLQFSRPRAGELSSGFMPIRTTAPLDFATWSSTLALFENEYAVPLLPPEIAAWLGTGVELVFPVLVANGLGSRFSALVLFVFNIVAVISYPDLGAVGLRDHQTWGLLLLVSLLHGPGRLSLDHLIGRHFRHHPGRR